MGQVLRDTDRLLVGDLVPALRLQIPAHQAEAKGDQSRAGAGGGSAVKAGAQALASGGGDASADEEAGQEGRRSSSRLRPALSLGKRRPS